MSYWSRIAVALFTVVLICGSAVFADTVELASGDVYEGTVARVSPGNEVDLLVVDEKTDSVMLRTFDLLTVTTIDIVGVDRMPDTLVAVSGDEMQGALEGSPLADPIRFAAVDGTVLEFAPENVSEIRFGPRAEPELASRIELVPSFGLGISLATNGIGIRRDAIAWFSEDWMLIASLGIHGWWRNGQFLFGVANEVTYMLDLGGWYAGIGSGAMFDFTNKQWYALLNLRTAIPIKLFGKISMFSLGVTLVW